MPVPFSGAAEELIWRVDPVALLTGTHINKVDGKGRVSVPKPFRSALSDHADGSGSLFVYRSYKHDALDACSTGRMERIAASLDDMDMFSDDLDDLTATILADAVQLGFDAEGRMVLPRELIGFAALNGSAAFVGLGRTFQIWNPDRFRAKQDEARARAKARGATLKLKAAQASSDDGEAG